MESKKVRIGGESGYDVICHEDLILPAVFKTAHSVEKKLSAIKVIEYQEGDVFLCGYPKCGNHWVSNLITYMQRPGPVAELLSINIPLVDLFSIREIKQKPSPRLFTTHFKNERLPSQHIAKNGKIILLLRNPKDVAVSYFYHMKHHTIGSKLSWEQHLQSFLEGKIFNGSYFDYLNSWTEVLKTRSIDRACLLIVYYEDLVQDCFKQLKRIQTFLGLTNSDARLQEIVDRCSIDQLRSDINSGQLQTVLTNDQGQSHIYRKGKVGDWKRHFTVTQNEVFNKQIKLKMKDSLFHFKYGPVPSKL